MGKTVSFLCWLVLLTICFGTWPVLAANRALSLDGDGDYVEIGKPMPEGVRVQDGITLEAVSYTHLTLPTN